MHLHGFQSATIAWPGGDARLPKINLQVLPSNSAVIAFYQRLGYHVEERISMGRRL